MEKMRADANLEKRRAKRARWTAAKAIRKAERRAEAEARNAKWAALTPEEKLESLRRRGHGGCAQAVEIFNSAY